MSTAAAVVRPVAGSTDLDRFVQLPWLIYRDDARWVPPLRADVRAALDPKHPFYEHADVQLFLAWRDQTVVGRIAAILNRAHNQFHHDRLGFFGLFESVDDAAVAGALLQAAEAWLRERGCDAVQGPFNLSTNEELTSPGVLIDGFDRPPIVMMSHSPPYYQRLLEQCGYTGAKDLVAYWVDRTHQPPERLTRALERGVLDQGVTVRTLDMRHLERDVAFIQEVYNSAWERNWGFVPMTPAEVHYLAKHLRPVVRPELCLLAFSGERPIAFGLALPDYNQVLRRMNGRLLPFGVFKFMWYRHKVDRVRVITLGVAPDWRHIGVDGMLLLQMFKGAVKLGMAEGECSWILEDNWPMRRGIERAGGTVSKTYRVYGTDLSA
jgi:GNAT superfamily N-acetyltransferase